MTGGGGKNKFGGHGKFIYVNSRGARGHVNLFQCGSNERDEYQKKKIFSSKISTNSGHRLKILAIFHEFLSVEQKKRGLRPKSSMKSGVSPQKLRKYGR